MDLCTHLVGTSCELHCFTFWTVQCSLYTSQTGLPSAQRFKQAAACRAHMSYIVTLP